jgi:hypothetical protein
VKSHHRNHRNHRDVPIASARARARARANWTRLQYGPTRWLRRLADLLLARDFPASVAAERFPDSAEGLA